ncbi:MAG: PglZ domain-containing protein [Lentisphaerae bacterium]|nr:PglZ domain-containing protein [Lentisphaerota bacterium]
MKKNLFWLQMPLEEIAAYLVLRQFADSARLQNPATQLAGLHVFAPETPVSEMEDVAGALIEHVTGDARLWHAVQRHAEGVLQPRLTQKVLDLTAPTGKTAAERITGLLQRPLVPIVLHEALREAFLTFLADPSVIKSGMLAGLSKQPLLGVSQVDDSERSRQCRMGIQCLIALERIEDGLAKHIPKFAHADALLDWYLGNGYHTLELQLSQAFHFLEGFNDTEVTQAGQQYLFGGPDDVSPAAGSLKGRLIGCLDALDQVLAGFVRNDPAAFAQSPRSAIHILRDHLNDDVNRIGFGQHAGRAWILVFDGLRFDTWETVVQPILAEHFEIKGQACFGILPSYTQVARTSLLAGCLPSDWKGFKGTPTSDEATLTARNLGLTAQEAKAKLRFVTGADTEKARMMLGFVDQDAAPLNVLIYPVSDECHDFRGDLAAFNNVIRMAVLGDKIQGVRGILDDLLRRIRPEDAVLVVSDHGFTELLGTHGVPVTQSEAGASGRDLQADVRWRYTLGFSPKGFSEAVQIVAGEEQYTVASGRKWFRREGAKGAPRYSHGGLSLAEVVVPGFRLRRVTEKTAQVEIEGLPASAIAVEEDESVELAFAVRNGGNIAVSFEIKIRTSLGEDVLAQEGVLPPGGLFPVRCAIVGRYRETQSRELDTQGTLTAVSVRLRHTDLSGDWRDVVGGPETVPVMVRPKQTKLDTDALKGFDDIK